MLISTKGRYALRVMIDLAEHARSSRVPLKVVAERQGISEKYLETILTVLVRNGMLSGMRGKGGGYRLTRQPEQYTVGEVLRLVEGELLTVPCLSDASACPRYATCPTRPLWSGLHETVSAYLDNITLADLCAGDYSALSIERVFAPRFGLIGASSASVLGEDAQDRAHDAHDDGAEER